MTVSLVAHIRVLSRVSLRSRWRLSNFKTLRKMKNIWLMFVSALCLTLFAGCKTDEPIHEPEPDAPQLVLTEREVEVTADGGHFEVEYELLNPRRALSLRLSRSIAGLVVSRQQKAFLSSMLRRATTLRSAPVALSLSIPASIPTPQSPLSRLWARSTLSVWSLSRLLLRPLR